jgi:FG-GAP repeat protein
MRTLLPILLSLCSFVPVAGAQERLLTWHGPDANSYFGVAVDGTGDLDGDGYGDVIVGAPGTSSDLGAVFVYSGRNGKALFVHFGVAPDGGVGATVAGVGDVNHDNVPDYAYSSSLDQPSPLGGGRVTVRSGLDGSTIFTIDPLATGPDVLTEAAIDGAGDVDGDGRVSRFASRSRRRAR